MIRLIVFQLSFRSHRDAFNAGKLVHQRLLIELFGISQAVTARTQRVDDLRADPSGLNPRPLRLRGSRAAQAASFFHNPKR